LQPQARTCKKDDVLCRNIDPQAQMKDFLDKKARTKIVEPSGAKQADEEIARRKDDTAMKQEEDELKRAQLECRRMNSFAH